MPPPSGGAVGIEAFTSSGPPIFSGQKTLCKNRKERVLSVVRSFVEKFCAVSFRFRVF
jgi:hypothetical protein